MTAVSDQAQPATSPLGVPADAGQPGTAQQSVAAEQKLHLYEAVAARRDEVLSSFAGQRAAILKAVADQRAAAVAPILAVQAKRAGEPAVAPAGSGPPAIQAGAPPAPLGNAPIGKAGRRRSVARLRRAVAAADIVAMIRTLVAAEVRAQLAAMPSVAAPSVAAAVQPAPSEQNATTELRLPTNNFA